MSQFCNLYFAKVRREHSGKAIKIFNFKIVCYYYHIRQSSIFYLNTLVAHLLTYKRHKQSLCFSFIIFIEF